MGLRLETASKTLSEVGFVWQGGQFHTPDGLNQSIQSVAAGLSGLFPLCDPADIGQHISSVLLQNSSRYMEIRRALLRRIGWNFSAKESKRTRRNTPLSESHTEAMVTTKTPLDHLQDSEWKIKIQAAIQELPELQREILVLHYYVGEDFHTIADVLQRSVEAIRQAHHRAKQILRRILEGGPEE